MATKSSGRQILPKLLAMDFNSAVQGSMFMTEQAAGSDISNTLTMAYPQDGSWRLYGEKWFCSDPDAGFGMVLAREGRPARHEGHLAVPPAASA